MDISLTEDQADVLKDTLDGVLDDLSTEIAATDNASYRAALNGRRDLLREVRARLGA
jgi:hypothetical protein